MADSLLARDSHCPAGWLTRSQPQWCILRVSDAAKTVCDLAVLLTASACGLAGLAVLE
jgi:hypothetical protein